MAINKIHDSKVSAQTHHGVTWVDVQAPDSDDLAKLERDYHLHPVHLKESVQRVQHTEVEREGGYLFLVLHFPIFEPRTNKIFAGQVGVFLGKNYLVTVHPGASPLIARLFTGYEDDPLQTEKCFKRGSAYVLYSLISGLLEDISGMTDIVEGELDGIEGLVFENNGSDAERIGKVRQKIVRLRRLIGPKRLVLEDLAEQIDSFTGQSMARYYSNNLKTLNRLWEAIEEAKETVEIYKDADFTTSTEQTNKTLAILTLVFTFTIPVTVLGSLYGMNVKLPGGLETGSWSFLGTYTTLVVVVAVSLLVALWMYVYFKKKHWL